MPTMTRTLVGTPDPDDDLHKRVAALENLLSGELQRLINAVNRPTDVTRLEARVTELEGLVETLATSLTAHRIHYSDHNHVWQTGGPQR